jgi:hypothetical protein
LNLSDLPNLRKLSCDFSAFTYEDKEPGGTVEDLNEYMATLTDDYTYVNGLRQCTLALERVEVVLRVEHERSLRSKDTLILDQQGSRERAGRWAF